MNSLTKQLEPYLDNTEHIYYFCPNCYNRMDIISAPYQICNKCRNQFSMEELNSKSKRQIINQIIENYGKRQKT